MSSPCRCGEYKAKIRFLQGDVQCKNELKILKFDIENLKKKLNSTKFEKKKKKKELDFIKFEKNHVIVM